jgi:hypothetical protein
MRAIESNLGILGAKRPDPTMSDLSHEVRGHPVPKASLHPVASFHAGVQRGATMTMLTSGDGGVIDCCCPGRPH